MWRKGVESYLGPKKILEAASKERGELEGDLMISRKWRPDKVAPEVKKKEGERKGGGKFSKRDQLSSGLSKGGRIGAGEKKLISMILVVPEL